MSDLLVGTVRKNNYEEVRVALRGAANDLVDVRIFAVADRSRGEPMPTRAGVCISRAKLPELIAALEAAGSSK